MVRVCVRVCGNACFVGNLTKHMKSKAHMKKCLELGVSMSSVEDNEADEGGRKHTEVTTAHTNTHTHTHTHTLQGLQWHPAGLLSACLILNLISCFGQKCHYWAVQPHALSWKVEFISVEFISTFKWFCTQRFSSNAHRCHQPLRLLMQPTRRLAPTFSDCNSSFLALMLQWKPAQNY